MSTLVDLTGQALFRKLIAGSKVVRIPRAGHSPMLEQPGRFVAAVKSFLG